MAESGRGPMFAEGAGSTLALVGYLAVAVVLMVADRRGGYLSHLRSASLRLFAPVYQIAQWPSEVGESLAWHLADRAQLQQRNEVLNAALMQALTEVSELRSRDAEAARIRSLVDFAARAAIQGKVARLLDVDLDPFSHRIVLDKGSADGISPGAVLFDGQGIVGQVIDSGPKVCVAMLISDPNHAIPIEVERSQLRSIALGQGRTEELVIDDLPINADIQVGDRIRTSGLGGRFPPGFAVGVVSLIERDPGAAFVRAIVVPAARLGHARELLLLPPVEFTGPASAPVAP